METQVKEISSCSVKYTRVQNLMYRVNQSTLTEAHRKQNGKKATGVDRLTKAEYEENLADNIDGLVNRMKKMEYKPLPVRRVYIPKANGKLRGLGIPAYEDKLVQQVFADILLGVYEPRFLNCSYGFRPNRKAHDVVREIVRDTTMHKVGWIVDADIKGFFDNVSHEWMLKFLEHDIADQRFLRYIARFLKAGIMEDTTLLDSDKGTPQGGLISPVLANVYLHYVLDLWMERAIKPRARGEVYYVRYADDFLIMCQYRTDAVDILDMLKKRLTKFALETAEDKTRILQFGRFCQQKESFDFLGFTFQLGKTRNGKYRTSVVSSSKKLKQKKKAVKEWLKQNMHTKVKELLEKMATKLRGHENYYGVNGNLHRVEGFYRFALYSTYRVLRHRSRKKRLTRERFYEIWKIYVSTPKVRANIWL